MTVKRTKLAVGSLQCTVKQDIGLSYFYAVDKFDLCITIEIRKRREPAEILLSIIMNVI